MEREKERAEGVTIIGVGGGETSEEQARGNSVFHRRASFSGNYRGRIEGGRVFQRRRQHFALQYITLAY